MDILISFCILRPYRQFLVCLVWRRVKCVLLVQIPAVFWWYQTCSHAAELTAGIYNPVNHDGYSPIFDVIQKYSVTVKFVCSGLPMSFSEIKASADLEALCWQVISSAVRSCI